MSAISPHVFIGAPKKINPIQYFKETLHRFVPKVQAYSTQAFDRFKERLLGESENLHFLRGELNLEDEGCQNRIASLMLSSNPYGLEGNRLRTILRGCNDQDRKAIIEKAFDLSEMNFAKISQFIALEGDVEEMAECLPEPICNKKKSVQNEIGKTFRVVTRFFPNFLDNVLKAFSVIDSVKSPETLWDFSAVMNIYFKLFMLPHALFMVVGAVVSAPASLFLITGGIITLAVVGICLYLKFRPCPNKLPLSTNLTEEAIRGNLDPVVGRDREIQQMSAYLGKKEDGIRTNIFLVGPTGVGKTELVKGIAQRYREKKIFALSAPELASGYNSIGDKIRLILLDIKEHKDEVVFFIDELGEAIKKNSSVNIAGILKPLVGRDGVQVIVAATDGEYQEIVVKDKSLCSRFIKVEVQPTSEEQTLAILRSRIENKGRNIRFEKGIEQKIYQACKEDQLPRTAVNMLDLKINLVSACDFEHFDSVRLAQLKEKLKMKRAEYQHVLDQGSKINKKLVKKIKKLVKKVEKRSRKDQKKIDLALKTRKLIKMERELTRKRNTLVHDSSKKDEVLFLLHYTLPWVRKKIEENLKILPDEFPLEVKATEIGS